MNNKGFTLIELLAVIVILAIIALIVAPLVLNTIDDAQKEADARSVELYARALKNAISAYQVKTKKIATTADLETIKSQYLEYTGDIACEIEEIKSSGDVYLDLCGKVDEYGNIDPDERVPGYGEKEIIRLSSICTPVTSTTVGNVPNGNYNIGDAYNCKVSPNLPAYRFFVVKKEGKMVDLIMDSNVNRDGTAVTPGTQGDTSIFIDTATYLEVGGTIPDDVLNDGGPCQYGNLCMGLEFGPVNAMRYLSEATSSWTNTNEVTLNSFVKADGTTENIVSRAKIISSELLTDLGCSSGTCPSWLTVNAEAGYWADYRYKTYYFWVGRVSSTGMTGDQVTSSFGVRPVITLQI